MPGKPQIQLMISPCVSVSKDQHANSFVSKTTGSWDESFLLNSRGKNAMKPPELLRDILGIAVWNVMDQNNPVNSCES